MSKWYELHLFTGEILTCSKCEKQMKEGEIANLKVDVVGTGHVDSILCAKCKKRGEEK